MVRAAQATITPCPTLRPPGREAYREQFGDDEERIRRRLDRERFVLPKGTGLYDLCRQWGADNIGELINEAR
jgi:type I restriction enzyme M protein